MSMDRQTDRHNTETDPLQYYKVKSVKSKQYTISSFSAIILQRTDFTGLSEFHAPTNPIFASVVLKVLPKRPSSGSLEAMFLLTVAFV